jgi:hypothetical protein
MDYDQYKPLTPFKNNLVLIHVLLQSLWLDSSPVANDGLWVNRNKQQQYNGGLYRNHQIVNSGHGS